MNSDQLIYLIELSKHCSLNAASAALHITPQALGIAIRKLEDELGLTLLNRSFRGVTLTDYGRWLVEESSSFLNKIDEYQQKSVGVSKQHHGELHLVVNYSGTNNNILGKLVCLLYQREPELKITLHEESKEDIFAMIDDGAIEWAFIFCPKLNGDYIDDFSADLFFEPLFAGKVVLNTAMNSPLVKFNTVSLKKIAQYPLCSYTIKGADKDHTTYLFEYSHHVPVQYIYEENYAVFQEKVRFGIANSLALRFPANDYQPMEGIKTIPLRDDIKVYFGYVKRRDTVLSENAQFFLRELKTLVKQSALEI